MARMVERTFEVESIHCDGCVAGIRSALEPIDGVAEVHADRDSDVVTVRFDATNVDDEAIAGTLAASGFPVVSKSQTRSVSGSEPRGEDDRTDREGREPAGDRGDGGAAGRYAVLVAAVVLVALGGYIGYVIYPRFELPAVQGAGLLGLAAAAGVASFFSPCSFPLLVGLLGRQAIAQARSEGSARPGVFGGALALGAAVFMLLAGVVIALGGEALFAGVTFTSTAGITIRTIVGLLLITLGLIQTGILPFSLHEVSRLARPITRSQARLRRERPVVGFTLFGFGYVLAGFG